VDSLIDSGLYMPGVRVVVDRPTLQENPLGHGPEQVVVFGVTRWYHELAEEGITVTMTPRQASALAAELDKCIMSDWGLRDYS